jgi:hypothetical protein
VLADQVAHVLDEAKNRNLALAEEGERTPHVSECHLLGRGNDQHTLARQGKSDIWVIASAILRMTSSQACSDEEMGNSTHSGTLASRHLEGGVVSISRFAYVRLDRLRSSLLRWTHSGVAGLHPVPLIGSRSTCEIKRGRSPLLPPVGSPVADVPQRVQNARLPWLLLWEVDS